MRKNQRRRLTFEEQEKAEKLKRSILIEQCGICPSCNRPISSIFDCDLAHVIPTHGWILDKYGFDVLYHRFNLKVTHKYSCNDMVMNGVNIEGESGEALIEMIKQDLLNE